MEEIIKKSVNKTTQINSNNFRALGEVETDKFRNFYEDLGRKEEAKIKYNFLEKFFNQVSFVGVQLVIRSILKFFLY